jgi:D-3-phosphoglycerate dehydrogenase
MMYKFWLERPLPPEYTHLLEGVAEIVELSEAEAVIAGGWQFTADFMDQAPHLCVISRTGIGYDNVDVAAATARGIVACNAPDAPTRSTAEMAITLIMAVARQLKWLDRRLQTGSGFAGYAAWEVEGKQLGLVGLGRIGSQVARMAQGLGMQVMAYDPLISRSHFEARNVQPAATLGELLSTADIVSLHIPLTPENRHMINQETLAQMKPGAMLINTARGGLVDEAALLAAVASGHLFGVGLDVMAVEPPTADHPLLQFDNVIVTPHLASGTIVGRQRLWGTAIEQALLVLRGERPLGLLNPEVWEGRRRVVGGERA